MVIMPKGGQLGNTNGMKGEVKRLPWYGTIAPNTKELIAQLATKIKCSQSEVVDRAISLLVDTISLDK